MAILTVKVLVELVAVCGGTAEVDDAQLDELIKFIDYDGDGNVTCMESNPTPTLPYPYPYP